MLQAGGELRQKILAVAAHQLEVAPEDLEIVEGAVRVRGVPQKAVPLAQVARLGSAGRAFGMDQILSARSAVHILAPLHLALRVATKYFSTSALVASLLSTSAFKHPWESCIMCP